MSAALRRAIRAAALLMLIGLLAGCSSTVPVQQRAAVAEAAAAPTATAAPATPTAETASDGPVTASMARLQLSGERFSALGDPAAPITIIEFSDFGCPFCRLYATSTLKELKASYIDTGKVYYVFKDYPIPESHPQAPIAAEAAECAGAQGGYWQMHDQLFADPSSWDGSSAATAQAAFRSYAAAIGLDAAAFDQCMASQQFAAEIQHDSAEGRQLGLTATPAFIINGKLLLGARPFEQFKQVLDSELAER